ncbi:MAG: hypothetical protein QM658_17795 [Gordonia sp. (in: high G+C Gram-positive bacteria)]
MTDPKETTQDVVKRFLPALPGTLGDSQAQKTLDGLAAAGYAVVKLPEPDKTFDDGSIYWEDNDIAADGDGEIWVAVAKQLFSDEAAAFGAQMLAAAAHSKRVNPDAE